MGARNQPARLAAVQWRDSHRCTAARRLRPRRRRRWPGGRMSFTKADLGALAPGRYRATLMLDDGYTVLAETSFGVR